MEIQFINPSGKPVTPNVDASGNISISTSASTNLTSAGGATSTILPVTAAITTGGTAQTILTANTNRKSFNLQNISTFVMYFNINTPAGNAIGYILPGQGSGYIGNETGSISLWCATTGAKYTITEE